MIAELPQRTPRLTLARRIVNKLVRILRGQNQPPLPPQQPKWEVVEAGPCQGAHLFIGPPAFNEMVTGTYDSYIFDAIARLGFCFEGVTCWDVGAHIGYHSLAFAALAGRSGRVVAFEPNAANRERMKLHLERNADLAQRIVLLPCALSELDGEQQFKFSLLVEDGSSSCSYLDMGRSPGDRASYQGFREALVPVRKADTLLLEGQIPAPKLIKVDVEGAELEVLRGAESTLRRHQPLLAMEIHNIQCMFHVQKWLFRLGYDLDLVRGAPQSYSRCFVLGLPRHDQ